MSTPVLIDRRVRPTWRDRRDENRSLAHVGVLEGREFIRRSPGRRDYDLSRAEQPEQQRAS